MAIHVTTPGKQASDPAGQRDVIDYTLMRVGTVIRRWRGRVIERVARCPECNRNGARREHVAKPGGFPPRPFVTYTHRTRTMGFFVSVFDNCFASKETEALQMREAATS